MRISGPDAGPTLQALSGSLPPPRKASLRTLRVPRGTVLDTALVLWFPGPATASGEDLAELHLHGGRAVVAAVEAALAALPGLRRAEPGEFTRRAFVNGRIDLAEAEGLADLLSAETELQRLAAQTMAGGAFSHTVEDWRHRVLAASALVEAALDFSDEGDVDEGMPSRFSEDVSALQAELSAWLQRPTVERLKEGFRVVLAGPPNAGKSTLFNALVQDEAAITSAIPGTTRDVLTRPVALDGVPFVFVDTAGLRDETDDTIEAIGIDRARGALALADVVLWLGPEGDGPQGAWEIAARCDVASGAAKRVPLHVVSAKTGQGMAGLRNALIEEARRALPKPGEIALNRRQRDLVERARDTLAGVEAVPEALLMAELLRECRVAIDALVGRTTTEYMLDALFGRFCIGK